MSAVDSTLDDVLEFIRGLQQNKTFVKDVTIGIIYYESVLSSVSSRISSKYVVYAQNIASVPDNNYYFDYDIDFIKKATATNESSTQGYRPFLQYINELNLRLLDAGVNQYKNGYLSSTSAIKKASISNTTNSSERLRQIEQAAIDAERVDLKNAMKEAERQKLAYTDRLNEIKNQQSTIERDWKTKTTTLDGLLATVSAQTIDQTSILRQVEQLKNDLNACNTNVASLNTKIISLQLQEQSLQNEIKQKSNQILALKTNASSLSLISTEIQRMEQEKQQLQNDLSRLQQQLTTCKQEKAQLEQKQQQLEQQTQQLNQQLSIQQQLAQQQQQDQLTQQQRQQIQQQLDLQLQQQQLAPLDAPPSRLDRMSSTAPISAQTISNNFQPAIIDQWIQSQPTLNKQIPPTQFKSEIRSDTSVVYPVPSVAAVIDKSGVIHSLILDKAVDLNDQNIIQVLLYKLREMNITQIRAPRTLEEERLFSILFESTTS